jgi:hypothetical protein
MADKKQKSKRILEGHKQVGKRFVPPMMQLPQARSMSYVDDMLPELIWLGLVNDRLGFVQGAQVFRQLVGIANGIIKKLPAKNFAILSIYKDMTRQGRARLVKRLTDEGLLERLRKCLAPLTTLYDEFPLRFIGLPSAVPSRDALLVTMKGCVGRHLDKYETPGIALNGMMLMSRLTTKTIKFSREIEIPDFDAIFRSPESDDAHRAAGFLRANALGEFGELGVDPTWARYFWNRGFQLSPCTFYGEEEPEESDG